MFDLIAEINSPSNLVYKFNFFIKIIEFFSLVKYSKELNYSI